MLNFLCFFVLFNAVKTYGENFYYLTYQDKILNLEGYIFYKFFTIKDFWDGLPVFAQQTIYHMRTEMRKSLESLYSIIAGLKTGFRVSYHKGFNMELG